MTTSRAASLDIQDAWQPDDVRRGWPRGIENEGLLRHLWSKPVALTAAGASGRVLEIAAAEAVHACRLAQSGLACTVVEPSSSLLAAARDNMERHGVRLQLVRGIGEALPFPDRAFDRILCDSALDHFASPELGVREMTRVLAPDGRLVLSFVNYAGLSARLSRLWYRVDRARVPETAAELRFWDSPVPHEHTFECTYRNMLALCGQSLELERAVGASMLFGVPGWGALLRRLPERQARGLVLTLDRASRRVPGLADAVFTVWRHRREDEFQGIGVAMMPRLARVGAGRPTPPPSRLASMRSSPADPLRQARTARASGRRRAGEECAGGEGWLEDLVARGPFRHAALLGGSPLAERWLRSDASPRLDVFEPSDAILGSLRHRLASLLHRVRLARTELDFLVLPARRYDVVWSSDGLRDVVNLEAVLDEITDSLRPGGLFAYRGYVGEPRQRFAPARVERIESALRELPAAWRPPGGIDAILASLEPVLGATRADEILSLAKARLELVHEARTDALFPLRRSLDVARIAREAPEVLVRLDELETAARSDPAVEPALAYVVLRKRA